MKRLANGIFYPMLFLTAALEMAMVGIQTRPIFAHKPSVESLIYTPSDGHVKVIGLSLNDNTWHFVVLTANQRVKTIHIDSSDVIISAMSDNTMSTELWRYLNGSYKYVLYIPKCSSFRQYSMDPDFGYPGVLFLRKVKNPIKEYCSEIGNN